MPRVKLLVIVLCVIATAGCGGLNPSGEDAGGPTTSAVIQTPETTSESSTTNSDHTTTGQGPTYDQDTNTDAILLRLSDLQSNYEYSGETDRRRSELNGSQQERYESQGILRQHSRSYRQASESNSALLIYSEVTIYNDSNAVESELTGVENTFEDRSADVEKIELTSGVSVTQITYENDRGLQNVLVYYQRDNLLLLVITSGREASYPQQAQGLMIEMVSSL